MPSGLTAPILKGATADATKWLEALKAVEI